MSELSPTERSTIHRGRKRAVTDRDALHAVLDAGLICHLAFVADGAPVVLPTGYGRHGDTLYLHGSTGAASLRAAGAGAEICVNVTLLDGIVYSRAVFHFSANYRSAVVHGQAEPVTGREEKLAALRVITEHLAPGSWDYAREPNQRELAATAVLALDLTEAAVKIRTGPPGDEPEDLDRPTWAGWLPLHRSWGTPRDCPLLPDGVAVPAHVTGRPAPDQDTRDSATG
ncbi:flavin-nucleotide-binding protein [Actinophytocola xinjiangensis]|uniref:Flavin-nucleotide-binding protein n=1 Tax=Actinophytocola xinjiangensis TaxID=485602 RepID=A0A7Z1AXX0_9PSEU|nr:pyridoxamine 5'-phosphate oxidase family protein [Actinophytocola xinjiangensis]OLF08388.1 flavin-nucleotide-binding protein [Actinophytocola xinjiangensis]